MCWKVGRRGARHGPRNGSQVGNAVEAFDLQASEEPLGLATAYRPRSSNYRQRYEQLAYDKHGCSQFGHRCVCCFSDEGPRP